MNERLGFYGDEISSDSALAAYADAYIAYRRVEEEVQRVCFDFGYVGSPLEFSVPDCGTLEQEGAMLDIYLALPAHVRRAVPEMARRMVRAVVLSDDDYTTPGVDRPTVDGSPPDGCGSESNGADALSVSVEVCP